MDAGHQQTRNHENKIKTNVKDVEKGQRQFFINLVHVLRKPI